MCLDEFYLLLEKVLNLGHKFPDLIPYYFIRA